VRAQVEKQARRERTRTQWVLALRQSVPSSKKNIRKALANWYGNDILTLQNKNAPQYYDPHTLLRKVEDYRNTDSGKFTMMLKVYRRGGATGRGMTKTVSIWRQKNSLLEREIDGFEPVKVHAQHQTSLKGLRQGRKVSWSVRSLSEEIEASKVEAEPVVVGDDESEPHPAFELGGATVNRYGGITGWEASFGGTVHKVELFIRNPHYKPKRSLLDKIKGANKPEPDPETIAKQNAAKQPKPKVTLASRKATGYKAITKIARVMSKSDSTVPEDNVKSKLKHLYVHNKIEGVPSCACIRQPDGSVGFFVETGDDASKGGLVRTVIDRDEEAANRKAILEAKQVQTRLIAKKLVTTMEALTLKFDAEEDAVKVSLRGDKAQQALEQIISRRETAMHELDAQAQKSLELLEKETKAKLDNRSEVAVPDWVSTLTEETTAWSILNPWKVKEELAYLGEDTLLPPEKKVARTTWPKFVQCVHLARVRPPGCGNVMSTEQLGTYTATYQMDKRDGPVELDKIVLNPMVVHRNLAIHYQRRLVEGWKHNDVMAEINRFCGLPVVWRGCFPFTGTFEPTRLRRAWLINWFLYLGLLAMLMFYFLSLRDTLDWPAIIQNLVVDVVIQPSTKLGKALILVSVLWFILEGPAMYAQYQERRNPHSKLLTNTAGDTDSSDGSEPDSQETPPGGKVNAADATLDLATDLEERRNYNAMQQGAILREIDERKQQAATAVARQLVPKLEAETKRHVEEVARLQARRKLVEDDEEATAQIGAMLQQKEKAHKVKIHEIEADAMMSLAEVERVHDEEVASCKAKAFSMSKAAPVVAPSTAVVVAPAQPENPPVLDAKAELAKMEEHKKGAMKVVAQHMMKQVQSATQHHDHTMAKLKEKRDADAADASMDAEMRRRSLGKQMQEVQRAHDAHLQQLEYKASVALQHVEKQHQHALSKLKGQGQAARQNDGGGSAATIEEVEAVEDWTHMEAEKQKQLREVAEKLMLRMKEVQKQHDSAVALLQARADAATHGGARTLFEEDIKVKEKHHRQSLEDLEAQAATAVEMIERRHSSKIEARQSSQASQQSGAGGVRRVSALELAASPPSKDAPKPTEARKSAIRWLEEQEHKTSSSGHVDPFPVAKMGSGVGLRRGSSSVKVGKSPVNVRVNAATNRARAVRQAYETLGIERTVSDAELDRLYAALLEEQHPKNHPAETAIYYEKKTKELKAAYTCVKSNRGGLSETVETPGKLQQRQSSLNPELAI